jgi:serine/threonine protein kinase
MSPYICQLQVTRSHFTCTPLLYRWHSIELPANPIATGGTGRLYKANCDGQLVAAKVIERKGTSESEYRNYLKLMSREVAALARVNHGNIVRMLGYSIDQPHHSVSPR